MKKLFFTLLAALLTLSATAQHSHRRGENTWRNDYSRVTGRKDVEPSVLDIRLRHPGELSRQLTPEDLTHVTTLIVEGVINDADIRTIAELGRRSKIIAHGKEYKAFLNVDLENVRYFNGDRECDYLPNYAFQNCKSLRSIVLPYRLREIGSSAFTGCISLEAVAMPDDVDRIGRSAFYDCASLTSIFIPDYITEIPEEAFRSCTMLSKVSLPEGLEVIGANAFRATALTSIDIPRSVRLIGENAFSNSNIARAHIPATVEHCAANAFSSWYLQDYDVEHGNPEYSSHDGVLYSADKHRLIAYPAGRSGGFVVPSFVTEINPYVFRSLSNLTSIQFECNLVEVFDNMFEDCTGLTRVVLPEGTQAIGKEAFRGCKSLTSVVMPSSVRRIGEMAFRACKGMSHIDLPEGLEIIGKEAFDYCNHLEELIVPATVRQIGVKAFYNCDRLMQLQVLNPQPPVAEKPNDNLKKIILKVPAGSASAYKASPVWGKFKNIQE